MALTITNIDDLLAALFQPGDLIEIKGLGRQRSAGLFNDFNEAAKAARLLNSLGSNVYLTSNPIDPNSEYARFVTINQLRVGARRMAGDDDITARRYYMIDIDPERPSGVAATDIEIDAATDVLKRVLRELKAAGLPKPLVIFSGNGYHLLLRADGAPADINIYRYVLRHLDDVCSTVGAKVDTAVSDLKRGIRMPFTVNRKGLNTRERPHREAELLRFPDPFVAVSNEGMHAYAKDEGYVDHLRGNLARVSSGTYELDTDEEEIESFINYYLEPAGLSRDGDTTYFRLAECPFVGRAHEDQLKGRGKTIIMYTGDKLAFICLAGGCQGHHWKDLRELLEEREGGKLAYQFWSRVDAEDEEEAFEGALSKWGCELDDFLEVPQVWSEGKCVGGLTLVPSQYYSTRFEAETPDIGSLTIEDLLDPFNEIAAAERERLHAQLIAGFDLAMQEIRDEADICAMARYLGANIVEELKFQRCKDRASNSEFAIREQNEAIVSRWQERPVPPLYGLTADDLDGYFICKARKMDESLSDYHARLMHRALMERVLIERSVEDMARFLGHKQVAEIAELGAIGMDAIPSVPRYIEEDVIIRPRPVDPAPEPARRMRQIVVEEMEF